MQLLETAVEAANQTDPNQTSTYCDANQKRETWQAYKEV